MKLSTNWEASIADGFFFGGRMDYIRDMENSRGGEVENCPAVLDVFRYFSQMKHLIGL